MNTNKTILLSLSLLLSQILLAQEQEKVISVGLHALLSNSYIINQNNYESLIGCPTVEGSDLAYNFTIKSGVSAKISYSFKKNWGISSGLDFVSKGQRYEDNFRPGGICKGVYNVKRSVNLNYLQIPFYAQYRVKITRKIHYVIDVGLYAALLVGGNERVQSGGDYIGNLDPIKDKFKSYDFGIAMLHVFQYDIKKRIHVSAGFRANYSLIDINDKDVKNIAWFKSTDTDYKRSAHLLMAFQAGIHYRFLKSASPFNDKDRD